MMSVLNHKHVGGAIEAVSGGEITRDIIGLLASFSTKSLMQSIVFLVVGVSVVLGCLFLSQTQLHLLCQQFGPFMAPNPVWSCPRWNKLAGQRKHEYSSSES